MNLIEQLGGYEKAKEVLINSSSYTHIDIYDGIKYFLYEKQAENMSVDNVVTLNPRTKEISSAHVSGGLHKYGGWHVSILDIEKALLQYRRENNFYEMGDYIIFDGELMVFAMGSDLSPNKAYIGYSDAEDGILVDKSEFKHASDEEIKAGKRLEVG